MSYAQTKKQHVRKAKSKTEQSLSTESCIETTKHVSTEFKLLVVTLKANQDESYTVCGKHSFLRGNLDVS